MKNEYSKIAKENQSLNGGNKASLSTLTTPIEKINTREQVAKDLDMSTGTLTKAQYIYNNASEEMIKQLDEGQLSINKAYNDLKGKLKQEQRGGNFPWLK
ncbi:hypothetical protein POG14_04645 [Clostridium paraputrificum]|uniref:hypothetical protein n=1 Tax=Clostridium paraputrificum TaxID=29363 RepID=UPI00189ABEA5|nr:hypothetical protein [Clostridium paraputrificum]MDC0801463.1 hypothetical protein [Clostridium paraputrificum]